MSVWVVDDEAEICHILTYLIKRQNLACRSFDNPLEALAEIKVAPPKIIICDYKMPQMNGLDFFLNIRDLWKGHFVILTGEPSTDPEELMKIGIKEVLFKPKDLIKVIDVIKHLHAL